MVAVCGVLPATGVSVKPWLWKAPMSTTPLSDVERQAALVGGDAWWNRARCCRRRWPGCRGAGGWSGSDRHSCPGPQPRVGHARQGCRRPHSTSPPEPPVPIRLYDARNVWPADICRRNCRRRSCRSAWSCRRRCRCRRRRRCRRRAKLPLTVQSVRLAVPELSRPPPSPAELPLRCSRSGWPCRNCTRRRRSRRSCR